MTLLIWFSLAQRKPMHVATSFFVQVLMVFLLVSASQPTAVWAQSVETLAQQGWEAGKKALQDKRYEDADQQLLSAFRIAKDSQLQAAILLTLGQSLSAQSQWYAAGQAFRAALAHDNQLTEAKIQLSAVLQRIPRPVDKSSQADKAGDRFEGVVSDWDEVTLDWDNPLLPQTSVPVSINLSAVQSPSIILNQAPVSSSLVQVEQARQDWILSGKMLDKQQDQRQFYRRLFSLEAGFGAVQDKPQAVEDVLPW
jgi:hypothetical protein